MPNVQLRLVALFVALIAVCGITIALAGAACAGQHCVFVPLVAQPPTNTSVLLTPAPTSATASLPPDTTVIITTPTPSVTRSLTPTLSSTATPSNTPTFSATPTPSNTPTATNTPTITNTPTATNTPTITSTPIAIVSALCDLPNLVGLTRRQAQDGMANLNPPFTSTIRFVGFAAGSTGNSKLIASMSPPPGIYPCDTIVTVSS